MNNLVIYLVRIESHKCTISDTELDHCGETLGFFPNGVHAHLPETQQELDHYCKERRHSVQCLKRYVHSCLEVDRDQKRLVKKYVSGYKKQLDDLCLHRIERQSKFYLNKIYKIYENIHKSLYIL